MRIRRIFSKFGKTQEITTQTSLDKIEQLAQYAWLDGNYYEKKDTKHLDRAMYSFWEPDYEVNYEYIGYLPYNYFGPIDNLDQYQPQTNCDCGGHKVGTGKNHVYWCTSQR